MCYYIYLLCYYIILLIVYLLYWLMFKGLLLIFFQNIIFFAWFIIKMHMKSPPCSNIYIFLSNLLGLSLYYIRYTTNVSRLSKFKYILYNLKCYYHILNIKFSQPQLLFLLTYIFITDFYCISAIMQLCKNKPPLFFLFAFRLVQKLYKSCYS